MTNQTPDQIAANWSSRLGASTEKMKNGISAVKVAPGQAAARQKGVWAQNVANSQDKWAARVSSVPLNEWQDTMINKGLPRVASGAQAAQGKMATFMTKLIPFETSLVAGLPARGTLEQNIQRAESVMRGMSKFKNS